MIVYFGGKFPFRYKDFSKEALEQDYRATLIGVDNLMNEPLNHPDVKPGVTYAGPFYFYEDGITADKVVEREALADACVFLLDDDAAVPGTVTEIINASMHHKVVYIFYVQKDVDGGEPERTIASPLWYPILFANRFNKDRTWLFAFESKSRIIKLCKRLLGGLNEYLYCFAFTYT